MGIIQSALTNRGLRLELEYREPAMIRGSSISGETPSASTLETARLLDELMCFLTAIEGEEAELA